MMDTASPAGGSIPVSDSKRRPMAFTRAWGIARTTLITESSSRGRILSTAFDIGLPVYLTVMLWRGLYADSTVVAGVTHDQAVTYAVLAALLTYLRVGNRAWVRDAMTQHIQLGTIVYWFLWPLRPAVYHLLRAAGDLVFALLWVVPALSVCLLTGAVSAPADSTAAGAALVSFILGQLIVYLLGLLLDLVCFWTIVNQQIQHMVGFVQATLSGGFVPLWFFPDWFQSFSRVLPFQSIVNIPLSIYTARTTGGAIIGSLAEQVIWCTVLVAVAVVIWRRAERRVDVSGG